MLFDWGGTLARFEWSDELLAAGLLPRLEALEVAPERALFVGGRLVEDAQGAAAVGMTTVQAIWFTADAAEGIEPDHQAFTMHDVLNIARRLAGAT